MRLGQLDSTRSRRGRSWNNQTRPNKYKFSLPALDLMGLLGQTSMTWSEIGWGHFP